MTFVGMDPAAMRSVATSLQARGRELEDMVQTVDGLVSQCVALWPGGASLGFQDTWHGAQRSGFERAAHDVVAAASTLMREVEEQERSSSTSGAAVGPGLPAAAPSAEVAEEALSLERLLAGGLGKALGGATVADVLGNLWNTQWYKGEKLVKWEDILPNGGMLGAALKGVGVGDALANAATAVSNRDWTGGAVAAGDLGFTFAAAPFALLWVGLKTEFGYFIPLDAATRSEHDNWMLAHGHTPDELDDRYAGVQGFINLGNDNVERKAPWANDIADAALQKPAEWLVAAGINLG